jgi:uncharacterized protein HemX
MIIPDAPSLHHFAGPGYSLSEALDLGRGPEIIEGRDRPAREMPVMSEPDDDRRPDRGNDSGMSLVLILLLLLLLLGAAGGGLTLVAWRRMQMAEQMAREAEMRAREEAELARRQMEAEQARRDAEKPRPANEP